MRYQITLLCLLIVVALAGCRRAASQTSAPVKDTLPPGSGTPGVTNPATTSELLKFEGTWIVTAAKIDGEDLSAQIGQEFVFAAGKLTLRDAERVLDTSKVVLNPLAKPKAIDLIPDELREGETPALFIYEFDGDTLRLCRGDKERPTSFVGKEQVVFTLKRKTG